MTSPQAPGFLRRLPFVPLLMAFTLAYMAIGYPLLASLLPADRTPMSIIGALATPLPVFALMGAWKWCEYRMGQRLVERAKRPKLPMTPARAKTEKQAAMALSLILPLFALLPLTIALMSGGFPGFSSFAPALVWGWIVHVFGWERMKIGTIAFLFSSRIAPSDEIKDAFRRFMTGVILEKRTGKASKWEIVMTIQRDEHLVLVSGYADSRPDDPDEETQAIHLWEGDPLALHTALTGDGDPYRLLYQGRIEMTVDVDDMSSHKKITMMQFVAAARKKAATLYSSDAQASRDDKG